MEMAQNPVQWRALVSYSVEPTTAVIATNNQFAFLHGLDDRGSILGGG
jgi:hypothetical protein